MGVRDRPDDALIAMLFGQAKCGFALKGRLNDQSTSRHKQFNCQLVTTTNGGKKLRLVKVLKTHRGQFFARVQGGQPQ
jgi:hypothetical protein